jgi:hypothetical protein
MNDVAGEIAQWIWSEIGLDPDETMFSDHLDQNDFAELVQIMISESEGP